MSLLLLGAGPGVDGGSAPPGVTWSDTDVLTPANFAFTGGNLTVERTGGGVVNSIGRATAGIPAATGTFDIIFTVVAHTGFMTLGLATAGASLAQYLGNSTDSIGYATTGEINAAGASYTTGVPTYTTGDVITMRVNLAGSTVSWLKNGTLVGTVSARPLTGALAGVPLFAAHHTQIAGPKVTADFSGHP